MVKKYLFLSVILLFVILSLENIYAATPISTCQELQNMNNNLAGDYYLTQDINCQGFDSGDGQGFLPIGYWNQVPVTYNGHFKGSLDGRDHTIKNLYINRPTYIFVGLFGIVDGANLSNIRMENVNINGQGAGGLVGEIYGQTKDAIIYRVAILSGTVHCGGGLAGILSTSVDPGGHNLYVNNSYSLATVIGAPNCYVGGFAGQISGIRIYVRNCYSAGPVILNGGASAHGFAKVENDYRYFPSVTGCYYDAWTSGQSGDDSQIPNEVLPKTTAQMKKQATFTTSPYNLPWDFTNIWAIDEDLSYPYFGCSCQQLGKQCGGPYTSPGCRNIVNCGACPTGQTCDTNGQCGCNDPCTPGQGRCNGQILQYCGDTDSDGCNEWGFDNDCTQSGKICITGPGYSYCGACTNQCTSGQKQCSGQIAQTCVDINGCLVWNTDADCSALGKICDSVSKTCNCDPSQCTLGDKQCNGQISQTCNINSFGCNQWQSGTDCESLDKICQGGVCLTPLSPYFANMIEEVINAAYLNSRVKLIVNTSVNIKDKNIEYKIYRDSGLPFGWGDTKKAQFTNKGFATWIANVSGKYYFESKVESSPNWKSSLDNPDTNYRYLTVSSTELNNHPVALIDSPLYGQIFDKTVNIDFNQSSYDIDDFFNYSWNLDDGIIIKGSSIDYINYNFTHKYSGAGEKNIVLNLVDERRAVDMDSTSILIIDKNSPGKYVFAGITSPKYGESILNTFLYNANKSYAVEVTPSLAINCIGGACPCSVKTPSGEVPVNNCPSPGTKPNFLGFTFTWKFDDNQETIIRDIPNITKTYSVTGDHFLDLNVSLITGGSSTASVRFKVIGTNIISCVNDHYLIVDGISYDTLLPNNRCKGADGIANSESTPSSDDCCPINYKCQDSSSGGLYKCMAQTIPSVLEIITCSNYTTQSSCIGDINKVGKNGIGTESCGTTGTTTSSGCFSSVPKTECSCVWDGSNCRLNKFISYSVSGINVKSNCRLDSMATSSCDDDFMNIDVRNNLVFDPADLAALQSILGGIDAKTWLIANCNTGASCFSGISDVSCSNNSYRLPFYSWFNFLISMIMIVIIYYFMIFLKKK